MYYTDSTKMGTKRVFSFQQKQNYIFLQYIRAVTLISPKYKSSKGFAISMRMQIFRVKKPSCKILKTKNCVPFEVQYTSNIEHQQITSAKYTGLMLRAR